MSTGIHIKTTTFKEKTSTDWGNIEQKIWIVWDQRFAFGDGLNWFLVTIILHPNPCDWMQGSKNFGHETCSRVKFGKSEKSVGYWGPKLERRTHLVTCDSFNPIRRWGLDSLSLLFVDHYFNTRTSGTISNIISVCTNGLQFQGWKQSAWLYQQSSVSICIPRDERQRKEFRFWVPDKHYFYLIYTNHNSFLPLFLFSFLSLSSLWTDCLSGSLILTRQPMTQTGNRYHNLYWLLYFFAFSIQLPVEWSDWIKMEK